MKIARLEQVAFQGCCTILFLLLKPMAICYCFVIVFALILDQHFFFPEQYTCFWIGTFQFFFAAMYNFFQEYSFELSSFVFYFLTNSLLFLRILNPALF